MPPASIFFSLPVTGMRAYLEDYGNSGFGVGKTVSIYLMDHSAMLLFSCCCVLILLCCCFYCFLIQLFVVCC